MQKKWALIMVATFLAACNLSAGNGGAVIDLTTGVSDSDPCVGEMITYTIAATNNNAEVPVQVRIVNAMLSIDALYNLQPLETYSISEDYTVGTTAPEIFLPENLVDLYISDEIVPYQYPLPQISVSECYDPITLTKTASQDTASVGDTITYTIAVDNPNSEDLNVHLIDEKLNINTAFSAHANVITSLSLPYPPYTVTCEDYSQGGILNVVTAGVLNNPLYTHGYTSASSYVTVSEPATIELSKDASPTTVNVGQTITYTITAYNPSLASLTFTLSDVKLGLNELVTLEPGMTYVTTKTYTTNEEDVGVIENVAEASGECISPTESSATVTVNPINHCPVAEDDFYDAVKNKPLIVDATNGVLSNDFDEDGDPLIAEIAESPAHGSVVLIGEGSFTYTPTKKYIGPDSFTYTVSEYECTPESATVNIEILSPDDDEQDDEQLCNDQVLNPGEVCCGKGKEKAPCDGECIEGECRQSCYAACDDTTPCPCDGWTCCHGECCSTGTGCLCDEIGCLC